MKGNEGNTFLSNGGDIRKEGGRIVVGWRFESNTRAKLIHSLKDGRKERQIVKKTLSCI